VKIRSRQMIKKVCDEMRPLRRGGPLYLCNDKCFYPYAASNATCLRSLTRQLCSSSSLPDL